MIELQLLGHRVSGEIAPHGYDNKQYMTVDITK